jgi:cell fate regulator YaaT (PSP1 superfamily)
LNGEAAAAQSPPDGLLLRVAFSGDLPGQVCTLAAGADVRAGDCCVVSTTDGQRIGRAARYLLPVLPAWRGRAAGTVLRRATETEVRRAEELARVERDALTFCRHRAEELGLALRPVTAVAPLDRSVLLMTFAAEGRIDYRPLLKDIGRRTRRRVTLRQVGVRDQAKGAGGWGPCGRTLCCSTFMSRFSSVTIRMAKAQNLSLSPSRISGMCGRLLCCLAHEAPPPGERAPAPDAAPVPPAN